MTDIYYSFKENLQNIFNSKKYPLKRCLSLISGFIKFTVNFYNNITYINEILQITNKLVEDSDKDEKSDAIAVDNLKTILMTPLENLAIRIINISEFPKLL